MGFEVLLLRGSGTVFEYQACQCFSRNEIGILKHFDRIYRYSSYLILHLFHQLCPARHLHQDQYVLLCCSAKTSTSGKAATKQNKFINLQPYYIETNQYGQHMNKL